MTTLKLRELNSSDEAAFFSGLKPWEGEELSWYTFAWKPGMPYAEMLTQLQKEAAGIDLPEGRVPASMLYGFVDGEIVGRVSIRHELNTYLLHRGGHIGYSVAPKFRRRGYATEMVRQALDFCRRLGLEEILVTCADENVPSWKIIETAGGVLQNKMYDEVDHETIRRYWIQLNPT